MANLARQLINNKLSQQPSTQTQLDNFIEQLEPILKHVTLHRFLWGFTLVCTLIAWNRGLMLLYALVAFLLAVLVISYIYYAINLTGLEIQVDLPSDNVIAGDAVTVTVQLDSRFTQNLLSIELLLQRVYQDSIQYDISPQVTHLSDPSVHVIPLFVLNSRGLQTFDCEVQLMRGVYSLPSAKVSCAYPLGIINKQRIIDIDSSDSFANDLISYNVMHDQALLYVLPFSFDIARLPIQGTSNLSEGQFTSKRKGSYDEFADIRRYRRGDALKTVHWGASARQVSRGKELMVKNYESLDMPQAIILLNQFDMGMPSIGGAPIGKAQQNGHTFDGHTFNMMVSLALSFANYLSTQNYQVSIMGFDAPFSSIGEYWRLDLGAHTPPTSDALRQLAEIDGLHIPPNLTTTATYQAFTQHVLSKVTQGLVVQFFNQTANMTQSDQFISHDRQQHQIYFDPTVHTNRITTTEHASKYDINPQTSWQDLRSLFGDSSGKDV